MRPAGVSTQTWQKVVELREARMDLEQELAQEQRILKCMRYQTELLQDNVTAAEHTTQNAINIVRPFVFSDGHRIRSLALDSAREVEETIDRIRS